MTIRVLLGAQIINRVYGYSSQTGGNPLLKIHPGTYLLYILLVFLLITGKRDDRSSRSATGAFALSLIFASGMVATALASGRNVGFGFLVDAVLVVPASLIILNSLPSTDRERIFPALLGVLLVNGLVVTVEALLRQNLFPYPEMGETFRPGGLVGHPLLTGVLTVPAIPLVAGSRWSHITKVLAIVTCVGICILSGARAASIAAIAAAGLALAAMFWENMRARGNPLAGTFYLYAVVAALILGAVLVPRTIFGERVMVALSADESFLARVQIYRAFEYLQPREILFGTTHVNSERIVERLGLEYVESPIVFGVFLFGVLGSALLFSVYAWVAYTVFRGADAAGKSAVVLFFLVAVTNNTLTTKMPAFLFATLLIASYAIRTASVRRNAAPVDSWKTRAALYKR